MTSLPDAKVAEDDVQELVDARQKFRQAVTRQRRYRDDIGGVDRRTIDLVYDDDVARVVPALRARDQFVALGPPVTRRIEHNHAQIGAGRARPGAAHAFLLDGVARLTQARRVGQHHRPTPEIEMDLYDVARRAGGLRHDRRVPARQQVEQRGLAGVGRADDGDVQT